MISGSDGTGIDVNLGTVVRVSLFYSFTEGEEDSTAGQKKAE